MLWKPIPVGAPGRGEARPRGQTEQVLALLTAPADREAAPAPLGLGALGEPWPVCAGGGCLARSFLFFSCLVFFGNHFPLCQENQSLRFWK